MISEWNELPRSVYRLSRAREHLPFVIPLSVLGALVSVRLNPVELDWRLLWVTTANVLAVTFAFMLNDVMDSEDDARDPDRLHKNPVASGEMSFGLATAVSLIVAIASIALYSLGGASVLAIGAATIGLSHLYSWRRIRLKALPGVDVASHSLMLGGLLLMAGFFTYNDQMGWAWTVAIGVTLLSSYGQLYNQLRDFEFDSQAGLRNTAVVFGESTTRWLMYGALIASAICFVFAFVQGIIPAIGLLALGLPLLFSLGRQSNTDARGTQATDTSGRMQSRVLLSFNLAIGLWLAWLLLPRLAG